MKASTFNVLTWTVALGLALACASQQPIPTDATELQKENALLREQLRAAESDLSKAVGFLKDCEAARDSK